MRPALQLGGVLIAMRKGVAVLVVGSPWSGAPLITVALQALGALVPADHPVSASSTEQYLSGWRSPTVQRLNAQMLRCAGRSLQDLRPIPDAFFTSPGCESARHHLDDFLEENLRSDPVVAIEDPEMCRLLPIWIDGLEAAGLEARVLHVVRHPAAVADALARDAGLSRSESDLLWLGYHLASHTHSRRVRHGLVSFEEYARDCERSIASWGEMLDLRWPRDVSPAVEEARRVVSVAGSANATLGEAPPVEVTPAVAETYRALMALTWPRAAVQDPVHPADDLLCGLQSLLDLMINVPTGRSSSTRVEESRAECHAPMGPAPGGLTGTPPEPGDDPASLREMLRYRDFELVRRDRELRGLDRRVAELSSELCWARAQMVRLVEEIESLHVVDTRPGSSSDDTPVVA